MTHNLMLIDPTDWLQIVDQIEQGKSYSPFHFLEDYSFEDSLNYEYCSLQACSGSALRSVSAGNKNKKVRWNVHDLERISKRHEELSLIHI